MKKVLKQAEEPLGWERQLHLHIGRALGSRNKSSGGMPTLTVSGSIFTDLLL